MSFTKIEIISRALTLLGKGPITSISQAGEYAEALENAIDFLYPTEIANNNWRFATKIDELVADVATPVAGNFTKIWNLPSDYLALCRLYPQTTNFQIYSNKLYSYQYEELFIEYRFLPDFEDLPTYFANLLSYILAEDYAAVMAVNKDYKDIYTKKVLLKRSESMSIDARSHPTVGIQDTTYIDVRT